jgi:hypothetical protein
MRDEDGISSVEIGEDEEFHVDVDLSPRAFVSTHFQSFGSRKTPTFMDSGMSDTMFVSRDAFIEYNPVAVCSGDSAKAVDGGFDIVGEGKVVQQYLVDGRKRRSLTLVHFILPL